MHFLLNTKRNRNCLNAYFNYIIIMVIRLVFVEYYFQYRTHLKLQIFNPPEIYYIVLISKVLLKIIMS
jgi:hypothetical protein